MKYVCPICGEIANPKLQHCLIYRTRYERHLTVCHIDCYNKLLKRGKEHERRICNSNEYPDR